MAEIYEIHRQAPSKCLNELMDVLRRHDGTINTQDEAINILGNLAMVFAGQDPARGAELLHDTFLSLTAFYDLPVVIERDRDGKGTMRISATSPFKPS
jgi:hypothetical protein